jgi:hypothetical protein
MILNVYAISCVYDYIYIFIYTDQRIHVRRCLNTYFHIYMPLQRQLSYASHDHSYMCIYLHICIYKYVYLHFDRIFV